MLISVVIPAYNVAGCIDRAIDSVLAQTHRDVELLVVDDASSDDTVALVERRAAADPRLRLLRSEVNAGPSVARNRGLDAASGEWVAVLDSDDAYVPERLERLLAIATAEDATVVCDNLLYYDFATDAVTGRAMADLDETMVRTVGIHDFLANTITGRSPFDYGLLKAMMRRDFLNEHRLRYPADLRHGEDYVLYARTLLAGARFVLTGQAFYYFTQRVGGPRQQRSLFSRTVANFDGMRRHTLQLLEHPAVDATSASLIRRRADAILWHQSRERMATRLLARDLPGLLVETVRDWRVAALLGQKVLARLVPSLGAGKEAGGTAS